MEVRYPQRKVARFLLVHPAPPPNIFFRRVRSFHPVLVRHRWRFRTFYRNETARLSPLPPSETTLYAFLR